MTAVTLQVQLPEAPTLPPDRLAEITGRTQRASQRAWLEQHGWLYELRADGTLVVGSLYAHLRLAGLNPADVVLPDIPAGFDLSKTR
jgi:hypothetical protein